MPAVSKKQQRFMGIVRAAQKGTLPKGKTSPEVQRAASSMKKGDVKKFASTKHKGLPEKKKSLPEGYKGEKKDKSLFARYKDLQDPKDPNTLETLLKKKSQQKKMNESVAVKELEDGLEKLDYPSYGEVDDLMKRIASRNGIDTTLLHMQFKAKHLMIPDDWAKKKMFEPVMIPKTPVKERYRGPTIDTLDRRYQRKKDPIVELGAEILKSNLKSKKEQEEVTEGGWDDVESIVFKNRANKGENTNPDFKQTVKNSKKNPLKDLRNKLSAAKDVKEGNLRDWFGKSKSKDGKGGWVNVVTGGTCASDEPGEGTPKCVSSSKRASMTKAERLSASRRKKKADPGQQSKSGAAKPTYVSTDKKKKVNEEKVSKDHPNHPDRHEDHPDMSHKDAAKIRVEKKTAKKQVESGNRSRFTDKYYPEKKKDLKYPVGNKIVKTGKLTKEQFAAILEDAKMHRQTDINLDRLHDKFSKMDQNMPSNKFMLKRIQKEKKRRQDKAKKENLNPTTQINDSFEIDPKKHKDAQKKQKMRNLAIGNENPNEKKVAEKKAGGPKMMGEAKKPVVKVKLNPDKKIGVKVTDIGAGGKEYVRKNTMDEAKNPAQQAAIAISKKNRLQDIMVSKKKKLKETVEMSRQKWKKTHKDFRNDDEKNPRVTRYVDGKGTVSSPVKFTEGSIDPTRNKAKEEPKDPANMAKKKGTVKKGEPDYRTLAADYTPDLSMVEGAKLKKANINYKTTKKDGKTTYHVNKNDEADAQSAMKNDPKYILGKTRVKPVKEETKRDEYGDPIGGPKISKKQLKKNLASNEKDDKITHSEAAAWTRKAGKNKSGGLNEKGRKSYERENPGSDLKAPSKKKGNKRRSSFCARMKGMKKKLTSAKTARDPDSRINKSLRAWNCGYEPETGELISEKLGGMVAAVKRKKAVLKQPMKAMDAGARGRRLLQRKEHQRYVSDIIPDHLKDEYTPVIEEGKSAKKCKDGQYYCFNDKKCKPIPSGYRIGYGGMLKPENESEETKGKNGNGSNGGNGNGNGNGGSHGGNGGSNGGDA